MVVVAGHNVASITPLLCNISDRYRPPRFDAGVVGRRPVVGAWPRRRIRRLFARIDESQSGRSLLHGPRARLGHQQHHFLVVQASHCQRGFWNQTTSGRPLDRQYPEHTACDPRTTEDDITRNGIALNILRLDHGRTLESGEVRSLIPDEKSKPSRAELARAACSRIPNSITCEKLQTKGVAARVLLSVRSCIKRQATNWEKNVPANESRTALYYSINQLLLRRRDENELPAAIVIATDGIDNDREHRIPLGRHRQRVQSAANSAAHLRRRRRPALVFFNCAQLEVESARTPVCRQQRQRHLSLGLQGSDRRHGRTDRQAGPARSSRPKRIPVKEGDDLTETLSFVPKKEDISRRENRTGRDHRRCGGAKRGTGQDIVPRARRRKQGESPLRRELAALGIQIPHCERCKATKQSNRASF